MPDTDIVVQSSVLRKPDATRTMLTLSETEHPQAFKVKSPDRAGRRLLVTYGVADTYTTFGTLSIDNLLETMRPDSDYREHALADSLAE